MLTAYGQNEIVSEGSKADAIISEAHRRAGVLVPLFVRDGRLLVLLTRRTESVEHHRGQISFPGGGEEPADETLYATEYYAQLYAAMDKLEMSRSFTARSSHANASSFSPNAA